MSQPLVFLHLSDIHVSRRSSTAYDPDLDIRRELVADAVRMKKMVKVSSGISVSGEIAFSYMNPMEVSHPLTIGWATDNRSPLRKLPVVIEGRGNKDGPDVTCAKNVPGVRQRGLPVPRTQNDCRQSCNAGGGCRGNEIPLQNVQSRVAGENTRAAADVSSAAQDASKHGRGGNGGRSGGG